MSSKILGVLGSMPVFYHVKWCNNVEFWKICFSTDNLKKIMGVFIFKIGGVTLLKELPKLKRFKVLFYKLIIH